MHLFRNVTFLYYHNRAITVVANTMGSKKHLSRVIKWEIFKREKSGVSARLWLPVGTGKVAFGHAPWSSEQQTPRSVRQSHAGRGHTQRAKWKTQSCLCNYSVNGKICREVC